MSEQRRGALDAVIFDWGGTLTPWHVINPADCWGTVVDDPELARTLAAAEDSIWVRSRDEHRSATLDEVIRLAGTTLTEAQRRSYHDWWEDHTHTDPQVSDLFSALRERGLKVGVLSNTIWPRVEHERYFRRDNVLDLIDGAVYSSEIAWTKPHREAFLAALAAVGGTDPSRAVYVGDRLFDDIHGAQSAGMRAVHVPHSVIPDWQRGQEGVPDAVISELAELLEHVDNWHSV